MLRKSVIALAVLAAATFGAQAAHALGVYADLPVQYTFSDCSQDCSHSPSGLKAGVILPSNLGIGVQNYTVDAQGASVDFSLVDISYLLPVPVLNIMLGLGAGAVGADFGVTAETGVATNLWASFGFPIIPLFDLHVGYHLVNAKVDVAGTSVDLGGTMWSIGTMLNF